MCVSYEALEILTEKNISSNHKNKCWYKEYLLCSKKDELYIMNNKRLYLGSVLFFFCTNCCYNKSEKWDLYGYYNEHICLGSYSRKFRMQQSSLHKLKKKKNRHFVCVDRLVTYLWYKEALNNSPKLSSFFIWLKVAVCLRRLHLFGIKF